MTSRTLLTFVVSGAVLASLLGMGECPGEPEIDCSATPDDPACMPQDPCATECQATAQASLLSCLADGSPFILCEHSVQSELTTCLEQQCGEEVTPTPPALPCDERCGNEGQEAFDTCVAEGNPEELCFGLQNDAESECLDTCVEPAPPSCDDTCADTAQAEFDACVAEGIPEMDCEDRYQVAFSDCTADCHPTPAPEQDCETSCETQSADAFDACVAQGGDDVECQQAADEQLEACQAACAPPEPVSCEDACMDEARALFDTCVAEGGDEAACKAEAQDQEASCQAACVEPEPTPPPESDPTPAPDSCETTCEEKAQYAYDTCLNNGDPEPTCQEDVYQPALDACLATCPTPTPEGPSCEDACLDHSIDVFDTCMANGGTDEECAALAGQDMDACQAGCSGT